MKVTVGTLDQDILNYKGIAGASSLVRILLALSLKKRDTRLKGPQTLDCFDSAHIVVIEVEISTNASNADQLPKKSHNREQLGPVLSLNDVITENATKAPVRKDIDMITEIWEYKCFIDIPVGVQRNRCDNNIFSHWRFKIQCNRIHRQHSRCKNAFDSPMSGWKHCTIKMGFRC